MPKVDWNAQTHCVWQSQAPDDMQPPYAVGVGVVMIEFVELIGGWANQ